MPKHGHRNPRMDVEGDEEAGAGPPRGVDGDDRHAGLGIQRPDSTRLGTPQSLGHPGVVQASAADPARELARAIQQYKDALPLLAAHVIGDPKMRALELARASQMPGLTDQPSFPTLRGQVALRWADRENPNEVLREALG